MDMTMQLSRTVKGQEEIFNLGHTLRPRHRQILFSVGNGISFDELCKKMPHCAELEAMVNDLLQSGFIQALRNMASPSQPAPAASRSPAPSRSGHPCALRRQPGKHPHLCAGIPVRPGGNQVPGLPENERSTGSGWFQRRPADVLQGDRCSRFATSGS